MNRKNKAALAALIFIAAAEGALAVGLLKKLRDLAVERAAAMYPEDLPEEELLEEEFPEEELPEEKEKPIEAEEKPEEAET